MRVELIDRFEFKLITDVKLSSLFEYSFQDSRYNWRSKQYEYFTNTTYLYHKRIGNEYHFWIGWLLYVVALYKDFIEDKDLKAIQEFIYLGDSIQSDVLDEEQLSDLNHLIKYKYGIFQVYTGYGKTESICALIMKYFQEGKVVLVVTPNNASRDEIISRLKFRYNYSIDWYFEDELINVINVNGVSRSNSFREDDPYWETVDYIIADEVEYVPSDSGDALLYLCKNVKGMWGFSATAEKSEAKPIVFSPEIGISEVIKRNIPVINYFGCSLIYKKPEGLIINLIEITTDAFDDMDFSNLDESNIYNEIITRIFNNEKLSLQILELIENHNPLYIPLNRTTLLDNWIENYFIVNNLKVINKCSRGYELWENEKEIEYLTLDQCKTMIDNEEVNVFTSTKSGFRALDFPKLNKVLSLAGKDASTVLQYIGRVARGSEFTIYYFTPNKRIPIYSRDLDTRINMIEEYYNLCTINKSSIYLNGNSSVIK